MVITMSIVGEKQAKYDTMYAERFRLLKICGKKSIFVSFDIHVIYDDPVFVRVLQNVLLHMQVMSNTF